MKTPFKTGWFWFSFIASSGSMIAVFQFCGITPITIPAAILLGSTVIVACTFASGHWKIV